jgi:hypothetical protein
MPHTRDPENATAKLEWQTPELEDLGTGMEDIALISGPLAEFVSDPLS